MTYNEQLAQPEWSQKRLEILERDGFKCVDCGLERPAFSGLVKGFGMLNLNQMREKGYQLFQPIGAELTHDKLSFIRDNWLQNVHFIGNETQETKLEDLLFSLLCRTVTFFGQPKKACNLVCFYKESINGQSRIDLNVHHEYYITGRKAWEYDNSVLVSLCVDCHKTRHEKSPIIMYLESGKQLMIAEICPRCSGAGYLKEFDYYMNGVCFQCFGEGVVGIESDA